MDSDLVSIIIPIYNTEKYLKKSIRSVINQSYEFLEIILVNDGSQDNSWDICEQFKKKDNRIVLINQKNSGVSNARNNGLKCAKGKFIFFMDSDDIIEPDMIKKMYDIIKDKEKSMAVCGCIEEYYVHNNLLNQNQYKLNFKQNISMEELKNKAQVTLEKFRPELWNKLFHRDVIKNEKFDESIILGEDLEFLSRVYANVFNIGIVNESLYHFRIEMDKRKKYQSTLFKDECDREEKIKNNLLKCDMDINSVENYIRKRIYLIAYTSCCYLAQYACSSENKIKEIINSSVLSKNYKFRPYGQYLKTQIVMKFFVKSKIENLYLAYFNYVSNRRKL